MTLHAGAFANVWSGISFKPALPSTISIFSETVKSSKGISSPTMVS